MFSKTDPYLAPNSEIWQGRHDGPRAMRMHEVIRCVDFRHDALPKHGSKQYGFIGFACDEGIRRNLGRPGASQGPTAFRKALANLPILSANTYFDFGDIICSDGNLELSQQALGRAVKALFEKGIHPIVIGGGHELAWGHYQGIEAAFPQRRCAIINIDAHFDMRPLLEGKLGTSGTSFLQIANRQQEQGLEFNYTCIGIQTSGNTQALFDEAQKHHVKVVTAEDIHLNESRSLEVLNSVIEEADFIYLTICLDVFAAPFAPGVSAPQPLGLYPWQVIPLLKTLSQSGKVVSVDIAELSPPHDQDGITAKLAASLIPYLDY